MTENLENTQNSKKQLCLPSFLLYLVFCAWIIEGTSINIYLTEWNEFTRDSHMVFGIKWSYFTIKIDPFCVGSVGTYIISDLMLIRAGRYSDVARKHQGSCRRASSPLCFACFKDWFKNQKT